jgi:Glutathione-dependent formaldehyde-activating enzyme
MTTRRAVCSCGQLRLTLDGEPHRISVCHCLECQRRAGAVISNQARFRNDQVTISGKSTEWKRKAESGNATSERSSISASARRSRKCCRLVSSRTSARRRYGAGRSHSRTARWAGSIIGGVVTARSRRPRLARQGRRRSGRFAQGIRLRRSAQQGTTLRRLASPDW